MVPPALRGASPLCLTILACAACRDGLTVQVLLMIHRPEDEHLSLQHPLAGAEGLLFGLAGGQGGLAALQLPPQPVDLPLLVPPQPDQVVPVLQIMLAALRFARLSLQRT